MVIGCVFKMNNGLPREVLLIKKERPDWQKGLWNLPGGRIEESDRTALSATRREIFEETGLTIPDGRPDPQPTGDNPTEFAVY